MVLIGLQGAFTYLENGQLFGKQVDAMTIAYRTYPHGPEHDDECDNRFPQFKNFHRCRLSKPSSDPDTMLIGDSHSGHLFNSMARLFTGNVVMNVVQQACLPFTGYADAKCEEKQRLIYSFIENKNSIKTVYLAGYWAHLMVGGFAKELMGGGVLGKQTSVADKRFYENADRLIANLIKSGKQVVFVLDVPDLPFNPKSCFSRPVALLQKLYDPCNQDRHEYEKRTEGYSKMIADVISSRPGLKVVDPKGALCDDNVCWAMKDNRLLYHDRHHLSAYGADLVVKSILAQQSSTIGQN